MRRLVALSLLAVGCRLASHEPAVHDANVCDVTFVEPPALAACATHDGSLNVPTFHGDRARTGWNAAEPTLTPDAVRARFGPTWSSPPLDSLTIGGKTYAAHAYASPLYVERVTLGAGPFVGRTVDVLIVATNNGFVYAIAAFTDCSAEPHVPAGTILWSASLGARMVPIDGGIPMGVLSTPFVDVAAKRVYVVSSREQFELSALDLETGAEIEGYPVAFDEATLNAVNSNGPAKLGPTDSVAQRGALTLSDDRSTLLIPFGAYRDEVPGWLVAFDVTTRTVRASFSAAPAHDDHANGGIWGAGGAALDRDGRVFVTTGNGPEGSGPAPHVFANALLGFDAAKSLKLTGAYVPWNYCQLDLADIDIGASTPIVFDLDPATTSTPHLLAVGGKQGNVYLLDRDALPAPGEGRPPCSTDATSDRSLLPPGPEPNLGTRGPLNVFGPYSEKWGNLDYSRMRTSAAAYRDESNRSYLFVSGSSKVAADSQTSAPPSIVRLAVVAEPGKPAYLTIDALDHTLAFTNPGSPVVSSEGAAHPIVWVIDSNGKRVDSLVECRSPRPVLYAVDGRTLEVLYRSGDGVLHVGGKYSTPVVARGSVFVATDRVQAFGLR